MSFCSYLYPAVASGLSKGEEADSEDSQEDVEAVSLQIMAGSVKNGHYYFLLCKEMRFYRRSYDLKVVPLQIMAGSVENGHSWVRVCKKEDFTGGVINCMTKRRFLLQIMVCGVENGHS